MKIDSLDLGHVRYIVAELEIVSVFFYRNHKKNKTKCKRRT